MQPRIHLDASLLKHRFQFVQRCFEQLSDFHRVRAVLAGHRHQQTGPPHDNRIAKLRFRPLDHPGHVLESDAETVRMNDDHVAEHFRRERLAVGLDRDALVRGFDEARAHDTGGNPRRRQHIRQRQPVGDQAIGQDLDLQLPHLTSEHAALRHARNREQTRLQGPIREGPQFHR